jgi:tetratricopeptide (TPR) repeat protein
VQLRQIEALLEQGNVAEGVGQLKALAATGLRDVRSLSHVGQLFTYLNLHTDAERCYQQALRLQPDGAQALYNWATSLIALGRLAEAEQALDRVLVMNPHDYDAYYNRATLRRQKADRNHVGQIEAALQLPMRHPAGSVALNFALAKELEDLGDYPGSFASLKRGADLRRRLLSYRVSDDVATMRQIAEVFGGEFFGRDIAGCPDERPVFILGLPRSGTTLVDRILSSHSQVSSRGETSDFAKALLSDVGDAGGKEALIRRSAQANFRAVGERYCARLAMQTGLRSIDKTPVNFLYLALIARALPRARIIHVRRNPMDLGYAIYKTLFRMAYPFSYDLGDLGHYYLAYDRLMAHWRAMLPGRFLEVHYEDLVGKQEATSRRLVEYCGLEWEQACLSFERNARPCLTASAAQVREPIYASSVGLWRRYREQLQPLASVLRSGGIDVDAA